MNIIKANGDKVPYKSQKLMRSLLLAGASPQLAQEILDSISQFLYPEITTKEIYKQAFKLLRKNSKPLAAHYRLKKAIMELGETGFPFEKFVSELLAAENFETKVGVIVQGNCVSHEVDVIAEKDNLHYMCECKFHNRQGRHCDVKIPLYIQSRFKDLEAHWQKESEHKHKFHQGWIFTNTRFTTDAIQYAECSGLQLISWSYPEGNSIRERVDRTGVHPVTCLNILTKSEKQALIDLEIVTCKNLCRKPESLLRIGVSQKRYHLILDEAKSICTLKLKK
jgi:hypothetical protein